MHVLLVSVGSLGDTLPALAWAKNLVERGHEVTLMINGYYRDLFEREGLDFVELLSAEEYQTFLATYNFWENSHSFKNMQADLRRWNTGVYEFISERYRPGETVVAAQGYFFGARIAQEKLGVPLATIHMQPLYYRSIYDATGFPAWCPRIVDRVVDRVIDLVFDRWIGPETNRFRAELGLSPPVKRLVKSWWNSPQLVIGFFPDWFNPPQPDWPPNSVLPGWPFYYGGNAGFDSTEIDAFLAEGAPPLVFSLSSVTTDAREYFQVSIDVAQGLGRRAVFLTPFQEQIPQPLPAGIRAFRFVPLEKLLPRSVAHVHHAGSGTVAHTLAAGIPHLTVPQGLDQIDIGRRLARLGVSVNVLPKAYRADRVVPQLAALLESPAVAEKCLYYAERCRETDALENASIALERLHQNTAGQTPRETSGSR